MTSTQFMPYFDLFLRKRITILSRIIWSYDSSGVQAKNYFGSMYEPILFCVKDKNNYTFNADDIMVEATEAPAHRQQQGRCNGQISPSREKFHRMG